MQFSVVDVVGWLSFQVWEGEGKVMEIPPGIWVLLCSTPLYFFPSVRNEFCIDIFKSIFTAFIFTFCLFQLPPEVKIICSKRSGWVNAKIPEFSSPLCSLFFLPIQRPHPFVHVLHQDSKKNGLCCAGSVVDMLEHSTASGFFEVWKTTWELGGG